MNKIIPAVIAFSFSIPISSLIMAYNQNLSPMQNKLVTDVKLLSADAMQAETGSKIGQ
jgi:hypothetical protein